MADVTTPLHDSIFAAAPSLPQPTPGTQRRTRDAVLATASTIINGDRQHQYGDAHESFATIAAHWSIILGLTVTAEQVARCMIAMKLSRLSGTPQHTDSWVDVAGYAALGAEVAGA